MTKLVYEVMADEAAAGYIADLLKSNGLDAALNTSKAHYDVILGDIDSMKKYEILLPGSEFEKADGILLADLKTRETEPDFFMNDYTIDELKDVVATPQQWGKLNYLTAKMLLEQRGVAIPVSLATEISTTDTEGRGSSKSISTVSKILLVVASISGFGFIIMGIGGVIMGLFLRLFKVHDTKGNMHYCFDQSTRDFGLVLFIISLVVTVLTWVPLFSRLWEV